MLTRVVPLIHALKTIKTTTSQRLSTMASANTAAPPWTPCKVALVQLRSARPDKQDNNAHMRAIVDQTVRDGKPDLIVLPEVWNSPNSAKQLPHFAESIPEVGTSLTCEDTTSVQALSEAAKDGNVWLVGGSIPEKDGSKLYNTLTVWSPKGELMQKYRKTHLFDLLLPEMTYKESDTFTPGDALKTFDTPFGRFGVGICYDVRFAEIAMLAARKGCMAMFYPAQFNLHTGPLHWELLQRARALDNQIYVGMCSAARDDKAEYVAYGHSMMVDPMGKVIAQTGAEPSVIFANLDPEVIRKTRAGIPLTHQRRFDLYPDIAIVEPR